MRYILLTFMLLVSMVATTACQDTGDKASSSSSEKTAQAPAVEQGGAAQLIEAAKKKSGVKDGCSSTFRAIADSAVVEIKGKGDLDVVVITDPLCWHCRLGHKILGEYPELWRTVRLAFFPRRAFIGSDMAAWVLEDAAGTDRIREMVDYAYDGLKQPKTKDLIEARMIVLMQFTEAFPDLLNGTDLAGLYTRLEKAHSANVLKTAALSSTADIPGTPVLIAGHKVLVGFGPEAWLDALKAKQFCE